MYHLTSDNVLNIIFNIINIRQFTVILPHFNNLYNYTKVESGFQSNPNMQLL